jgi:hypothetical protein
VQEVSTNTVMVQTQLARTRDQTSKARLKGELATLRVLLPERRAAVTAVKKEIKALDAKKEMRDACQWIDGGKAKKWTIVSDLKRHIAALLFSVYFSFGVLDLHERSIPARFLYMFLHIISQDQLESLFGKCRRAMGQYARCNMENGIGVWARILGGIRLSVKGGNVAPDFEEEFLPKRLLPMHRTKSGGALTLDPSNSKIMTPPPGWCDDDDALSLDVIEDERHDALWMRKSLLDGLNLSVVISLI